MDNPFGGDDIQMGTNGLFQLPWDFAGDDPNIPLSSHLNMSDNGRILLGAVDIAIVSWTRLNSRDRSSFITPFDSMRIYGLYQQMLGYLLTFAGDENRVDVVPRVWFRKSLAGDVYAFFIPAHQEKAVSTTG